MLEIRNATPEDLEILKRMYLTEVENHEERAESFSDILINQYKPLLAIKDSDLCGTVSWDSRGGLDDGVVELLSIGVNEDFQRQGIATKLVNSIIQEETRYFSEKFYSSIGFKESATIKDLYPHDDGSIWTLHL